MNNFANNKPKICVIGLGYIGLPTACILATHGFSVTGVDINQERIDLINQGLCPFEEPELPKLLQKAHQSKLLTAQRQTPSADVFILCVPTPVKNQKIDLTYINTATKNLLPVLNHNNLIIIESTIAPKTCLKHITPILNQSNKKYFLAHCPERAIPSNSIYEIIHNDRIIGGTTTKAAELSKQIYQSFVKGQIYLTDVTTAETCKLMENTYRDTNIALANEFAKIAEELNINIWEAIELANKHPRANIHLPGPGVGGHCLAVDPWFLTQNSKSAQLIPMARQINDQMPEYIFQRFLQNYDLFFNKNTPKPTVAILGIAYKKNVDDSRETPANKIIELLQKHDFPIKITDPYVKQFHQPLCSIDEALATAQTAILITGHNIYQSINLNQFTNLKFIIDTRNCLPQSTHSPKIIYLGKNDINLPSSPQTLT